MATEPDDYQSISDDCPGYMVLISEGIICTRCAGEKRHKPNDCPKPLTATDLATDTVPDADPTETDNADSGTDSLSDIDSESSESTDRSEDSEMRVAAADQSDQGGSHPQNAHVPRRGFARPNGSYTSTEPDRTSLPPPDRRAKHHLGQDRKTFIKAEDQASNKATQQPDTQSRRNRGLVRGPNSLPSVGTPSLVRSGTRPSNELPSINKPSSTEQRPQRGSHSRRSNQQVDTHEATGDRYPSKGLGDTTGKFEYSNTTCPSSFGFGRLPSEAMG
ncbi:hypothetical protein IMSHALPRED_002860 [Imshaugia aleurites]|uniref:Uncharacterized protein n=1 Tax=Imshaugia aleurites TaxID=172621 RepID=A0A8H3J6H3_9LECA|nr:hypothetical protein IMSHALPRED_002860 [Imshaugia aleurites]